MITFIFVFIPTASELADLLLFRFPLSVALDVHYTSPRQAYNYDKSVFGFVRGFYGLLETVALFYFNGLPYVWNLARQILLESGFDESYEVHFNNDQYHKI